MLFAATITGTLVSVADLDRITKRADGAETDLVLTPLRLALPVLKTRPALCATLTITSFRQHRYWN